MLFNIYLGNHSAYDFLRMQDILVPVAAGLEEAGHRVQYDLRRLAPAPAVNLLIEFFKPEFIADLEGFKKSAGERLRFGILGTEDLDDASVMANPAQPWRRANFERALRLADFAWTLLPNTAWYHGHMAPERVGFLRYGHCPALAQTPSGGPKDIDGLLYGTSSPYRETLLAELRKRGHTVFVTECALPDYLRTDVTRRARVILDIRRNAGVRYSSPSRIAHALHSGTAVAAEKIDSSELGFLYDFCATFDPAAFVDGVDSLLKSDTRAVAAEAGRRFAAQTSMRANLEAVMTAPVFSP